MLGDLKVEEFCHAIPGRISKYLNFLMNYTLLSRNGSTRAINFVSWLCVAARGCDAPANVEERSRWRPVACRGRTVELGGGRGVTPPRVDNRNTTQGVLGLAG